MVIKEMLISIWTFLWSISSIGDQGRGGGFNAGPPGPFPDPKEGWRQQKLREFLGFASCWIRGGPEDLFFTLPFLEIVNPP